MPHGRRYLPFHLTRLEKRDPVLRKKLRRMIERLEEKYCRPNRRSWRGEKYDYRFCDLNPVAVARSRLEHSHRKTFI